MVGDGPTSMDLDRENVGLLLLQLGDPQRSLNKPENQARAPQIGPKLSKYAIHFVEHISSASYSYLVEVRLLYNISFSHAHNSQHAFLQQVESDSRTWYLIPHYLDTIMHWGVLL